MQGDGGLSPLPNVRILHALLRRSSLHVYDDGHLALVTAADELGPLVSRFLTAPGDAAGPGSARRALAASEGRLGSIGEAMGPPPRVLLPRFADWACVADRVDWPTRGT